MIYTIRWELQCGANDVNEEEYKVYGMLCGKWMFVELDGNLTINYDWKITIIIASFFVCG